MSKRRLLLADDSITIQKVVNLTFADENIEVITVGDGDAAMLKFAEAAPDLVLADVNMPGLDGYQICEQIKQNEATRKIPVILLVGSFEPFDEEKARRVGADDFLTKPFQSIRQLVDKVSDLLNAKTDDEGFSSLNADAPSPVNSFDDTLEIESPVVQTENFGDAGMDDEMIHTAQIGSMPVDEAKKFESAPVDESFAEDIDRTALKQPYTSSDSNAAEFGKDEDWAKTKPFSKADLEEILIAPANRETDAGENEAARTSASSQTISDLNFEAFDLLEFPQTGKRATVSEIDLSTDFETSSQKQNPAADVSGEPVENLNAAMIEAIADRVVEKLSSKVIKRVVSEVLAQMERRK